MWNQVEQALNRSMTQVLSQLASLLPGVAALIVAILVSVGIAWALATVLHRLLHRFRFEDRFAALKEWSPAEDPTLLVTRVVFWCIVLLGLLVGIAALDSSLTSQFAFRLFTYLPNVVAACLVILAGNVIARFMARSVLIGAVNMNLQYARLLSTGVKWMILVLALAMALEHLAIGGSIVHIAFGILFGGIVFALALAVGLGSKELVSRSLEREAARRPVDREEPFRHV
jgi:hypothetical protein